jgi:hypothetical protein
MSTEINKQQPLWPSQFFHRSVARLAPTSASFFPCLLWLSAAKSLGFVA